MQIQKEVINGVEFDLAQMYESLGDDGDLMRSFFLIFKKNLPKTFQEVENSFASQQGEELYRGIHTIKGSLSNFYVPELVKKLVNIENEIKLKNFSLAHKLYFEVKSQIQECLPELEKAINRV